MEASSGERSNNGEPSLAEVEQFTALYQAHLRSDAPGGKATQAWEEYQRRIPEAQKTFFGDVQQRLRSHFHAQQAQDRRHRLASLLAQTPPFSQSVEDRRFSKSRRGQRKRYTQLEQFVLRYATRSAIGVHPFFASLKRVLEYQGSGHLDRSCQWLLDDAVLMETGNAEWLEAVVWALKGILRFEEEGVSASDPFVGEAESLRWWTVDGSLSDPECTSLARLIPTYVVPRRGRGSEPVQRIVGDEESLKEVELPTGKVRLSDKLRDEGYRGDLVARLWSWLLAMWY